ncbi:MAG TPA: hypothetical protein VK039_05625 [Brevibacterium sp.]|nr:hypothetical protein [Brevibacterium sp.]
MTCTIESHPNFDADDRAYLAAKGWTDAEIMARWDAEHAAGKGPCRWNTEGSRSKLAAILCAAR